MTERRYTDDEIREIFELAATAGLPGGPGQPRSDGLTLEAIQDIGREVGLAPDVVARAAASLDARPARPVPAPPRSWPTASDSLAGPGCGNGRWSTSPPPPCP